MPSLVPEVFAPGQCALGESPVWDEKKGGLLWLDILNRELFFKAEGDAQHRVWSLPCICSAIFLAGSEFPGVLLATERGLASFNLENSAFKVLAVTGDERESMRSNDGGVDRSGKIWFGTMAKNGGTEPGAVYCWTRSAGFKKVLEPVYIPNTFVWNKAGSSLVSADSFYSKLYSYSCGLGHGELKRTGVLVDVSELGFEPDGSAMDEEELFWNAQWNGSRVVRYSLDGVQKEVVAMPVLRPTSCCFGGADLSTLYITSARTGLDEAQQQAYPLSGVVFHLRTKAKGLAIPKVSGIGTDGELA